jgi:hypothetical protein
MLTLLAYDRARGGRGECAYRLQQLCRVHMMPVSCARGHAVVTLDVLAVLLQCMKQQLVT